MEMLFENADFQNDIFLREHQTALKNLHNCLTITSNLMADLENLRHDIDHKRKQECIQLYESTMKILTSFSEIFRQFNIEIQTTSFKLDANVMDRGSGSSNAVMTNGYGNHTYDDVDTRLKDFIYPKYDISMYKENYFGDGVVAYVEDADKHLCFIIDADRAYDQNLYDTLGSQLSRLPMPGEVFGIDLGNDGIFRAVRDNCVNAKRKQKSMRVLLIDTGEVVEAQADTAGKYTLSEGAQTIPGRSIRCKVEEIFEEDGVTKCDDTSLTHILYESMRFRVTKTHNNLLYIKVYRKGIGRFDELACNTEDAQNGDIYRENESTLNPFATEFSFKCLNNTPVTFYNAYQTQPSNLLTTVGSSISHQRMPSHSIPYVINQNCPPLSSKITAPMPSVEYHQSHPHGIVVHHPSPPIPLQSVQPVQTIAALQPVAVQTVQGVSMAPAPMQYFQSNVVELFPDVYQNDEASFRETNLGKYDTSSNLKRMQNHLKSGGACFIPTTSPPGVAQAERGSEGGDKTETKSHRTRVIDNGRYSKSKSIPKITAPPSTLEDARANSTSPYENDKSESSDSLCNNANLSSPRKKQNDINDLTKEQLEELYEEPFGTQNALKAVMGYVPQDDKRICKHYDPKLKGCFKGNNCKLEHVLPIKDGWTRDRSVLKTSVPTKLPMPAINQSVKLIPTFVNSVEEFYAQIPELAVRSSMSLIKLNEAINSTENRNRYRRMTKPPNLHELVLATYKSSYIYRAKVLEVDDHHIKVFYVDYGNCSEVALRNLFIWEDRWDHIPFQAYHCYVSNIKMIKENDVQSTKKFKNMIYNKRLTAIITDNIDELFVRLVDDDGADIGEKLVKLKMALPHKLDCASAEQTNRMPG